MKFCSVYGIWKQVNILIVTLLFDMSHFLLQRFNRPVEAGLKTLFITISEVHEKCRASGACIGGLINLGDEVYSHKAGNS
jgi:hypothetical protein